VKHALAAVLILFCIGIEIGSASDSADHVDPRSFGAKCDGKTDDSAALQRAIDSAISQNMQAVLPSGTCSHSATLRLNVDQVGVNLVGKGGQGSGASRLKYTGTRTGYTVLTEVGNKFVYNLRIMGVAFVAGSGSGADIGIDAVNLSEALLDQVGWWSGDPKSNWRTVFHCVGCNIMTIHHPVAQFSDTVFDFQSVAAIFMDDLDLFENRILFNLSGSCTHLVIRDGWLEMQDIGVLVDASNRNTSIQGLFIHGNRFLFNAQGKFNASSQVAFKYLSKGIFGINASAVEFHDNTVFLAPNLTNTDYPVAAELSGSGQHTITTNIHDNSFIGANKGIAKSNKETATTWNLRDNYSVDSKLKPHQITSSH
jgi:hypothetical protein